jgi:hypothetical protein
MTFKIKKNNPQDYIAIGMAFFLLGAFISMVADDRMIGAFIVNLARDQSAKDVIQGVAAGCRFR